MDSKSTVSDSSTAVRPSKSGDEAAARNSIYPLAFFAAGSAGPYLREPAIQSLLEFFAAKGLDLLKREDRLEQWYEDWIDYQRQHKLYAAVLSPSQFSSLGNSFDLLRYARFLEAFAYCSPAHGYSLQVTFLGLFSILMGSNNDLKEEAVAQLEAGNLLAFGVSEKDHGSDLLGNEFVISDSEAGDLIANGSKYYIGNTDAASIISILGRRITGRTKAAAGADGRQHRAPFMLIAVRPKQTIGFRSLGKIRTLGVRAANVGSFEISNHLLDRGSVIAEGRNAWDAVFGTVTLGKFFLGFGSIGICERAFEECIRHLASRKLYGKPVIDMPHIRSNAARAGVRLTAMKLYAFRTLDYVQAAALNDRRYLLFCAVQKARVSTEGLKVMGLLQECIGAKGFESDTYFEMALRDIQLIPSLEGSMHINLGLATQMLPRYFGPADATYADPPSLVAGEAVPLENSYLMEARNGSTKAIGFPDFLSAYGPLMAVPPVAQFVQQVEIFREWTTRNRTPAGNPADLEFEMALGQCFATIVYGELVAENAVLLELPGEMTSVIFSVLVEDLGLLALHLAGLPQTEPSSREAILRMVIPPSASTADWDFAGSQCLSAFLAPESD